MDRGAWWTAVYGVTQSRSRLKRLSMHALIGEGNGNPLQYSCLENPVDRGAWWAAVHRVAQSWTQLKRLSMHACIGEGNGNPLQCSCLENPRDGGAWWAAVYGVTQSWTRLKQLSSSSSRCAYGGGESSLGKRGVRGRRLIRQQNPPDPRTILRRQKVWPFRGRM